jgi:hypothetical protein
MPESTEKTPAQIASSELIKECFKDQQATINERNYDFKKMNHFNRIEVFSFIGTLQRETNAGSMAFLATDDYRKAFKVIEDHVAVDGALLSKSPAHWNDFPEDYMTFVMLAFSVISYPFMKGSHTS